MIKHYGSNRNGRNLRSLINTDFSAKIKTNPSRNTKNDVVWATGIIKDRVEKKKCENLASLKREITKAWREMNADKNLLARLIGAIPKRCRAVISVNGDQIR